MHHPPSAPPPITSFLSDADISGIVRIAGFAAAFLVIVAAVYDFCSCGNGFSGSAKHNQVDEMDPTVHVVLSEPHRQRVSPRFDPEPRKQRLSPCADEPTSVTTGNGTATVETMQRSRPISPPSSARRMTSPPRSAASTATPASSRPFRQVVAGGATWFPGGGGGVALGPDGAPLTRPSTASISTVAAHINSSRTAAWDRSYTGHSSVRANAWDRSPARTLAHGINLHTQVHRVSRPASARTSRDGFRRSSSSSHGRPTTIDEMHTAATSAERALHRLAQIRGVADPGWMGRRWSSGLPSRLDDDYKLLAIGGGSGLSYPPPMAARPPSWSEPPPCAAVAKSADEEVLIDLSTYTALMGEHVERTPSPGLHRAPREAAEAELPWLSFAPG